MQKNVKKISAPTALLPLGNRVEGRSVVWWRGVGYCGNIYSQKETIRKKIVSLHQIYTIFYVENRFEREKYPRWFVAYSLGCGAAYSRSSIEDLGKDKY